MNGGMRAFVNLFLSVLFIPFSYTFLAVFNCTKPEESYKNIGKVDIKAAT